jgi:hypothetical protein
MCLSTEVGTEVEQMEVIKDIFVVVATPYEHVSPNDAHGVQEPTCTIDPAVTFSIHTALRTRIVHHHHHHRTFGRGGVVLLYGTSALPLHRQLSVLARQAARPHLTRIDVPVRKPPVPPAVEKEGQRRVRGRSGRRRGRRQTGKGLAPAGERPESSVLVQAQRVVLLFFLLFLLLVAVIVQPRPDLHAPPAPLPLLVAHLPLVLWLLIDY